MLGIFRFATLIAITMVSNLCFTKGITFIQKRKPLTWLRNSNGIGKNNSSFERFEPLAIGENLNCLKIVKNFIGFKSHTGRFKVNLDNFSKENLNRTVIIRCLLFNSKFLKVAHFQSSPSL